MRSIAAPAAPEIVLVFPSKRSFIGVLPDMPFLHHSPPRLKANLCRSPPPIPGGRGSASSAPTPPQIPSPSDLGRTLGHRLGRYSAPTDELQRLSRANGRATVRG